MVPRTSEIAVDTTALPWEERFNDKLGRALYRKNLVTDPDTGMEVRLVRYPAGVINVRHTHPCVLGGQIHVRRHTRHAIERFLDASGASGTSHAGDAQVYGVLGGWVGSVHR
jgi:hypothetical protein